MISKFTSTNKSLCSGVNAALIYLSRGEKVVDLPCGCTMHEKCADKWFNKGAHINCPKCYYVILSKGRIHNYLPQCNGSTIGDEARRSILTSNYKE